MEERTDLSAEFARPDGREFHPPAAGLEYAAGRSPEFNKSPHGDIEEFSGPDGDKEFFGRGGPVKASKTKNRRARRRRTLLLQTAAAALSVVVVTSSFGEDILGSDALAGDPPPVQEEPAAPSAGIGGYGKLYILPSGHNDSVYLVKDGQVTGMDGQVEGVSYHAQTNTLTLDGCSCEAIRYAYMGDDFTIYVQDDSWVGHIEGIGSTQKDSGSLTIGGDHGKTLYVNQGSGYERGIFIRGNQSDSALTVAWPVNVMCYGRVSAVRVAGTTAQVGIDLAGTYFGHIETTVTSRESGSGGRKDWTVTRDGSELKEVSFNSGYGG